MEESTTDGGSDLTQCMTGLALHSNSNQNDGQIADSLYHLKFMQICPPRVKEYGKSESPLRILRTTMHYGMLRGRIALGPKC